MSNEFIPDWGHSNPYPSYLKCLGCGKQITQEERDNDDCKNCERLDNTEGVKI